jgi:vancomycin permeability regulator SanA
MWLFRMVFILSCLVLLGLFIPRVITSLYAYPRTYIAVEAPNMPVAIVFGAGLRRDGSPTAVLRDRVTKGAELYLSGKVSKLLMSGDNRSAYYDEPSAMKDYAVSLGVPEADIVLDYAGLRTYDTCYRARGIFGVRQAILVTQDFHLPRALYTCNALGIKAVGVAADRYTYRQASLAFWNLRETIATVVAVLDVYVTRPVPVMGQPQPIFPPEI